MAVNALVRKRKATELGDRGTESNAPKKTKTSTIGKNNSHSETASGKLKKANNKTNSSSNFIKPKSSNVKFKGKTKVFKKSQDKTKPVILSNKDAHKKIKDLRDQRRGKDRSHYEVTVEMKQIWEDLRKHDLAKEERGTLIEKVMTLVRGKERDFAFAHDTSRIFQTLCKYASQQVRSEIFESLKESLLEMTKSKYSVFFVRSLLRKGTKDEKNYIIEKLMSNARKLLTHRTAGPVVEFAYNEFANAQQRLAFSQQFYGPNFSFLSTDCQLKLPEVLEKKPEKKPHILKYMKEALESIVQKEALAFTFVHNLLYEYLAFSDNIQRQAMSECLQEHIAHIVHTREGAKAGAYVVWYSSAKGRKAVIKQIKPYLDKLLVEEYGHLLLLAIFDAVDDTKLVAKLIISTISDKLAELLENKWARRVIIYLISPRDPANCNKEIRDFLSIGDGNPFSKKDASIRRRELLDEFLPKLVAHCCGNLTTFLGDSQLTILLGMLLTREEPVVQDLVTALVSLYCQPYAANSKHILDNKSMRFITNRLWKSESAGDVAQQFVSSLTSVILDTFVGVDSGCILLANVLACCKDQSLRKKLVGQLSKYRSSFEDRKDTKPQQLLLEQLV